MDTILNLLSQLASALSPTEFILILGVIGLVSFGVIIYFIKNVRKKSGLWSFLNAPEEEVVELKDVLENVESLTTISEQRFKDILESHKDILAGHKEILINVLITRDENRDKSAIIIGYLEHIKNFEGSLNAARVELVQHIDELHRQFSIHDLHDQQLYESLKTTLVNSLLVINRINAQVDKMDEYARTAVPEFKLAHKELNRDINNLSRDIALVERSIQSQINNVNAVTLR